MARRELVVCIPARNEEERLPRLLEALAHQSLSAIPIIVALNNTTDRSRLAIDSACAHYPDLDVVIDETNFEAQDAHAGSARRRAMDIAAGIAGPSGFILTTDADTRPPPDWLAENLSAMTTGLDIVGGRIVIDETELLAGSIANTQALADRYWARVRAIEDAIDPVIWDPPPRHGDHTGASLCVSVSAYRRCGGVPALQTGEDQALVQAVVRQGGRLAHPASIWTRVSPRTDGRAAGGMADHFMRLKEQCRANKDVKLPSFAQWRARAAWRQEIRKGGGSARVAELEAGLPSMIDDMVLNDAAFGPIK